MVWHRIYSYNRIMGSTSSSGKQCYTETKKRVIIGFRGSGEGDSFELTDSFCSSFLPSISRVINKERWDRFVSTLFCLWCCRSLHPYSKSSCSRLLDVADPSCIDVLHFVQLVRSDARLLLVECSLLPFTLYTCLNHISRFPYDRICDSRRQSHFIPYFFVLYSISLLCPAPNMRGH